MSTTAKRLTGDEAGRLARLAGEHEQKAADYRTAGLHEEAATEQERADALRARLAEDRKARQEDESREWERKRQQKEAQEAREREEAKAEQDARAFLEKLFTSGQPVEVGAVFDAAEQEGVGSHHLLAAAGEMGLRSQGWLKSGTRTLIDRGKGMYWGPPNPFGPMIDAGPPSRPAA